MSGIALWWIGEGTPPDLAPVGAALAREYGLPVTPSSPSERPAGCFDPKRGQVSSRGVLEWLASRRPAGPRRLLGVTDADLFIPILTFVFGEAQMDGRVAVVSTWRLAGTGLPGEAARAGRRLVTEAVHELGHTFGLLHCTTRRCAMSRSSSLREVDAKDAALCADCRALVLERRENLNGDSDEQEEHAHPAGR